MPVDLKTYWKMWNWRLYGTTSA